MSIKPVPVVPEDLSRTLDDSANQITFINTAIIAICERPCSEIGEDELMGLQTILFDVERKIRGAAECISENARLLMQNQVRKSETSKKAI
jgi:hypothetical protein